MGGSFEGGFSDWEWKEKQKLIESLLELDSLAKTISVLL